MINVIAKPPTLNFPLITSLNIANHHTSLASILTSPSRLNSVRRRRRFQSQASSLVLPLLPFPVDQVSLDLECVGFWFQETFEVLIWLWKCVNFRFKFGWGLVDANARLVVQTGIKFIMRLCCMRLCGYRCPTRFLESFVFIQAWTEWCTVNGLPYVFVWRWCVLIY